MQGSLNKVNILTQYNLISSGQLLCKKINHQSKNALVLGLGLGLGLGLAAIQGEPTFEREAEPTLKSLGR